MAQEQDAIGWRQFMEGMISKQIRGIQALYHKSQSGRVHNLSGALDNGAGDKAAGNHT